MQNQIDEEYNKMKDQMSLPIMPIIMTKNLKQLQNEAEQRFEDKFKTGNTTYSFDTVTEINEVDVKKLRDFLKTELTNIVKESFKNTRVEEKKCNCRSCAGEDGEDCGDYMYDQALLNKHKKECEFLGE